MIYYFGRTQFCASIIIYLIVIIIVHRVKSKREVSFFIFLTLLYAYIVCVVYYTIFPIYADNTMKDIMGAFSFQNNINIIPFRDIYNRTSMLNIAMTIPFGFLLPFIARMRLIKVITIGIAFGSCIEIIQLAMGLNIGFSLRIIDINDVICNTIGTLLGYLIFIIFVTMLAKVVKDDCSNKFLLYMVERQ